MTEIIVALSATNLCRVWENPTGAAFRNGRLIRYGLKGSADITGILRNGRRLEIEVKTGKAVQQENQKSFEQMILRMGGIYFVARSVEGAVSALKSICNV